MIYNQWYAVLDAREVKKNRLTGTTRFSEKLVFWRNDKNDICCIADKCCHRGARLSCGTVVNGHAASPFHGFEYDITGKVMYITSYICRSCSRQVYSNFFMSCVPVSPIPHLRNYIYCRTCQHFHERRSVYQDQNERA